MTLDNFFRFVSNSNSVIVIGTPLIIGTLGYVRHNDNLIRNSCVILLSSVVNTSITLGMKYSIDRHRPYLTYTEITKKSGAGSPSFPSGHTSSAFATAASLSLIYPKWYVIVPSFTWAGTVGYSRMHLGVHYPSDVLIGAFIGTGSAWLTHVVNNKLNKR